MVELSGRNQSAALPQTLAELVEELRASAPGDQVACEADAYILRVYAASLNDAVLAHHFTQDGLSRAIPVRGCPNPDYILRHASLNGSGSYRLSVTLNESERVGVGLYRRTAQGSLESTDYRVIDADNVDFARKFVLSIVQSAESSHSMSLSADTTILLIRILHRTEGPPAQTRLEGDIARQDLALAGGTPEAALSQAIEATQRSVRQFLSWSAQASNFPNQFRMGVQGLSQTLQGDPDTSYALGYFDLIENQVLRVAMPADLRGYWSLHAYNHWCESIPGASVHDKSASGDNHTGIVAFIGPTGSPEMGNFLDTRGRAKGILICRFIGSAPEHAPQCDVITLPGSNALS